MIGLLLVVVAAACGGQPELETSVDDLDPQDLEDNWEDLENVAEKAKFSVPDKEIALQPQDKLLLVIRQGQTYQRTGQAIRNAPLNVHGFCDALALHDAIWQDARGGPMFSLLKRLWSEPDLCSHRRGWTALKNTIVSFSGPGGRLQRQSVQTLMRQTVVPSTRVVSNLRASLETAVLALWQPAHNSRPQKSSVMTSDIQELVMGVEADSGVVGSKRKPQLGKWSENSITHLLDNCMSCDPSDEVTLRSSLEQYFEHSISPLWSYPDGKLHIPSPGNYDDPPDQSIAQRFMNFDPQQRNDNLLKRFMADLQHMPDQVVIASGHAHYWQQFMKRFNGGDQSCSHFATKFMDPGAVVAMRVHGDGRKFGVADCYVVYGSLSVQLSNTRPPFTPGLIVNPNVLNTVTQNLDISKPDPVVPQAAKQSVGGNTI